MVLRNASTKKTTSASRHEQADQVDARRAPPGALTEELRREELLDGRGVEALALTVLGRRQRRAAQHGRSRVQHVEPFRGWSDQLPSRPAVSSRHGRSEHTRSECRSRQPSTMPTARKIRPVPEPAGRRAAHSAPHHRPGQQRTQGGPGDGLPGRHERTVHAGRLDRARRGSSASPRGRGLSGRASLTGVLGAGRGLTGDRAPRRALEWSRPPAPPAAGSRRADQQRDEQHRPGVEVLSPEEREHHHQQGHLMIHEREDGQPEHAGRAGSAAVARATTTVTAKKPTAMPMPRSPPQAPGTPATRYPSSVADGSASRDRAGAQDPVHRHHSARGTRRGAAWRPRASVGSCGTGSAWAWSISSVGSSGTTSVGVAPR